MYIPEAFAVTDPATIRTFLADHPFGVLAFNGGDGVPVAAHLPFLLKEEEEKIVLEGHFARANELTAYAEKGAEAKMIVTGVHGYVSSSVYGHVNVPTYNYQAVHLTGSIGLLTGEALFGHLQSVVGSFEQNREKPIVFGSWPQAMIESYMREIVGFRLNVSSVEAAFKLSQNRSAADFNRIVQDLRKGNSDQVRLAEAMTDLKKP